MLETWKPVIYSTIYSVIDFFIKVAALCDDFSYCIDFSIQDVIEESGRERPILCG